MNMDMIKKLPKSVEIKLEQYECKDCKKKFYVNSEDKTEDNFSCIFCGAETNNIRIFEIKIEGIGEY